MHTPNPSHSPPLDLPTLHLPPSWCNCHGRIDRAACFELTTPRFWRRGEFEPARTSTGRVASALVQVTTYDLDAVQSTHRPRRLAGDWRTGKARVMKPDQYDPKIRHRVPLSRFAIQAPGLDHGLASNPNRGAARVRTLALLPDWSQTLRIEKWQYDPRNPYHLQRQGRPRDSYVFTCPGIQGVPGSLFQRRLAFHASRNPRAPFPLDPRTPPLSDAPRGTAPRRHCPQRVRMLYLPLASEQERVDAAQAQLYLRLQQSQRDYNHRATARTTQLTPFELQLLSRYALLFHPRTLLCGHCLALRFANSPNAANLRRARFKLRRGLPHKLTPKERHALHRADPDHPEAAPLDTPKIKPRKTAADFIRPLTQHQKRILAQLETYCHIPDPDDETEAAIQQLFHDYLNPPT